MSLLGRAVFATKPFLIGQFPLEYPGELISDKEAEVRETNDDSKIIFRYYFKFDGKNLW